MDIYFTYESAACDQYMKKARGPTDTIIKTIAPLRVEGTGTEKLKLFSGCNFVEGCKNKNCWYSSAGRQMPRVIPKS